MRRGESRGFRLGNAEVYNLSWLFCQADAEIAGLAGQGYEPRGSADTTIDHLFLQERLVSWGNENIARQTRLREIARRMVTNDPARGWDHWGWLKRVYGPLSTRDPHEHFGRELAPLARITPAALSRAEKRWPHWHLAKHEERYGNLYEQLQRDLGRQGAVERMMRLLPDDAHLAGEAEEVMSEVLDGACFRSKEAQKYNQRLAPADTKLLVDAERQADEMLSAAGQTFQTSADNVDEEAEETTRERGRREDREKAKESLSLEQRLGNLDKLLAEWPDKPARKRFWDAKKEEAA